MMILAAIAMTVPIAKPNTQAILDLSWKETRVIGHRGAAAYQPENTLESFREAIRCQADATECDIHMSQDGKPMVIHDATVDRTFKPHMGKVDELSESALMQMGVPTLHQLTDVTKDKIVLVVEIKAGKGVAKAVVDHLNRERMREQTIIFSFHREIVEEVEQLDSKFFTVWLQGKAMTEPDYAPFLDEAAKAGVNGIGVQFRNATAGLVQAAHARKVPVFVWTAPPGEEVDRLKSLKVNFIITDHPRDVRAQLGIR